jgi:hypothetical protein
MYIYNNKTCLAVNGLFLNCTLISVDNISIYSGVNLANFKNKRLRVRELFP